MTTSPSPEIGQFDRATTEINAWRGRCLSLFTRAEHAVTEALMSFSADTPRAVPLLIGERYSSLLKALEDGKGMGETGAAIEAFRRHDDLRCFLCHGLARVLLDRQLHWTATFVLLAPVRKKLERRTLIVGAADAPAIASELRRDLQRLEAKLRPFSKDTPQSAHALRIASASVVA